MKAGFDVSTLIAVAHLLGVVHLLGVLLHVEEVADPPVGEKDRQTVSKRSGAFYGSPIFTVALPADVAKLNTSPTFGSSQNNNYEV